jgi:hypothetical protein
VGTTVEDPEQVIAIESFTPHPEYEELQNGTFGTLGRNDVSVVVLTEEAVAAPVWLRSTEVTREEIGAELVSIGFGITDARTQNGSGVKRSVPLVLSDIDRTFLYTENDGNPTGGQICSGDSGGPQVHILEDGRVEQWAVHSWGDANCTQISGSTRVDSVYAWVLEQVEAVPKAPARPPGQPGVRGWAAVGEVTVAAGALVGVRLQARHVAVGGQGHRGRPQGRRIGGRGQRARAQRRLRRSASPSTFETSTPPMKPKRWLCHDTFTPATMGTAGSAGWSIAPTTRSTPRITRR